VGLFFFVHLIAFCKNSAFLPICVDLWNLWLIPFFIHVTCFCSISNWDIARQRPQPEKDFSKQFVGFGGFVGLYHQENK